MENNIENKYSFFAQYWNVEAHKMIAKPNLYKVGRNGLFVGEFDYLVLKPLSSITDEDSIFVSNIVYGNDEVKNIEYGREYIMHYFVERPSEFTGYILDEIIQINDYLRSKSYALAYMGLSVEKLKEYGWIQLKPE